MPLLGSIIAATVREINSDPINIPVPVSGFLFLPINITNRYVIMPKIAMSSIAPIKRAFPITSPEFIFSPGPIFYTSPSIPLRVSPFFV